MLVSHCRRFMSSVKAPARRVAVVIGSSGELGAHIVQLLEKADFKIIKMDVHGSATVGIGLKDLESQIAAADNIKESLDAVICTAGGWAGGSLSDSREILVSSERKMHDQCLQSALVASRLAVSSLKPRGALILTTAAASFGPTPSMIAYGCYKAATNHLIATLATPKKTKSTEPTGQLARGCAVYGIAPTTLDTTKNRAAMPNADTSSWTPLQTVGDTIMTLIAADGSKKRAHKSGSVLEFVTTNNETTCNVYNLAKPLKKKPAPIK